MLQKYSLEHISGVTRYQRLVVLHVGQVPLEQRSYVVHTVLVPIVEAPAIIRTLREYILQLSYPLAVPSHPKYPRRLQRVVFQVVPALGNYHGYPPCLLRVVHELHLRVRSVQRLVQTHAKHTAFELVVVQHRRLLVPKHFPIAYSLSCFCLVPTIASFSFSQNHFT